jgi:hypothetical protein
LGLGKSGIGRVDEQSNHGRPGDHFVQQRQLLWPDLHAQRGYAGEIAARSGKACDKSDLDRVGGDDRVCRTANIT